MNTMLLSINYPEALYTEIDNLGIVYNYLYTKQAL